MTNPQPIEIGPDAYGITLEVIEAAAQRYRDLDATTPAGYEEVRLAIADCRGRRGAVETARKELKSGALEYGRRVDAIAKDLTARLEAIEEPLKERKTAVDAEKQASRDAKERAQREEYERQAAAARAAQEAIERAQREAETQRIATERAALEAERAKLATERAESDRLAQLERDRQAVEAARLRAEREAIETERRKAEETERTRLAVIEAEKRAKAEAEAQAERDAVHWARLASLAPDAEKLLAFADALQAVQVPELQSDEADKVLVDALGHVAVAARVLRGFGA